MELNINKGEVYLCRTSMAGYTAGRMYVSPLDGFLETDKGVLTKWIPEEAWVYFSPMSEFGWRKADKIRPLDNQICKCYDKVLSDVRGYVYNEDSDGWFDPIVNGRICDYVNGCVIAWNANGSAKQGKTSEGIIENRKFAVGDVVRHKDGKVPFVVLMIDDFGYVLSEGGWISFKTEVDYVLAEDSDAMMLLGASKLITELIEATSDVPEVGDYAKVGVKILPWLKMKSEECLSGKIVGNNIVHPKSGAYYTCIKYIYGFVVGNTYFCPRDGVLENENSEVEHFDGPIKIHEFEKYFAEAEEPDEPVNKSIEKGKYYIYIGNDGPFNFSGDFLEGETYKSECDGYLTTKTGLSYKIRLPHCFRQWNVRDAYNGQVLRTGNNVFKFYKVEGGDVYAYSYMDAEDGVFVPIRNDVPFCKATLEILPE